MIIFIVPKNSGLKICQEIAEKYKNKKTKIIKVRGEDIPFFVNSFNTSGVIGITGEDLFYEYNLKNKNNLQVLEKIFWKDNKALFKKPCLCLLGNKDKNPKDFVKPKICINKKYSNIAENYLSEIEKNQNIKFRRFYFSGCTEEACFYGISDFVIDIVYSGESIKESNLFIKDKILESNLVVLRKRPKPDFKKMSLIPTIIQDMNGVVLTLVYSNKESYEKTLKEGVPYFYSRSRNAVVYKGSTSGNTQELVDIKLDCDSDALLFKVKQKGNACHLNQFSCFNEKRRFNLDKLYEVISGKIAKSDKNSYTNKLSNDSDLLNRKIIEEAGEVVTAKNKNELIWECADLFYFLLTKMSSNKISIKDIEKELLRRNKETLLNKNKLNEIREAESLK